VRRLLEAVGHQVSKLRRVAIGPLTARGLKPGQFRSLSPAEVRSLIDPPGGRVTAAWGPPAERRRIPRGRGHGEPRRHARPHGSAARGGDESRAGARGPGSPRRPRGRGRPVRERRPPPRGRA
jgi:hypothetical protein